MLPNQTIFVASSIEKLIHYPEFVRLNPCALAKVEKAERNI
jgi:hypothetical protein